MTSAPRSSKVGEKCALVALAAMLIHRGLAVAQEPVRLLTPQQAEVVVNGSVLDIGISAGELHRAAPQGAQAVHRVCRRGPSLHVERPTGLIFRDDRS